MDNQRIVVSAIRFVGRVLVNTQRGTVRGEAGDWLITLQDDERYVMKGERFQRAVMEALKNGGSKWPQK